MKMREAIARAVENQDARLAGALSDVCRFRLGLNYQETLELVQSVRPEVTPAEWDALLYVADSCP